jgi:iron complex outermembrane receptor protein
MMLNFIPESIRSTFFSGAKTSVLLCAVFVNAAIAQDSTVSTEAEPLMQLEAFEVRSPAFTRLVDDFAQPVRVIDSETLAELRQSSIGETLAGLPGVSSTNYFPGASRPVIRGFSNDRIRILANGIDTLDASVGSHDHAVGLEPHLVEEVEIVRGPASLLYGSNAVGGVVNANDRRIPRRPFGASLSGELGLEYDSAPNGWTQRGLVGGDVGSFSWTATGLRRRHGDLSIPGDAAVDPDLASQQRSGTLENSAVSTNDYSFGTAWIKEDRIAGISISRFETRYGLGFEVENEVVGINPDGSLDIDRQFDDRVEIDARQTRVDAFAGWIDPLPSISELRWRIGLSDYAHDELEDGDVGTTFKNRGFETRLELVHEPVGIFEGAFGIQASQSRFSAIGDEAFIRPNRTRRMGLFIFEEAPMGEWTLQAGARVEYQEINVSAFERDNLPGATGIPANDSRWATSASLGAIRDLGDRTRFTLGLSYTERLPSAQELYADGPHIGTFAFERSDSINGPTFKTEDSFGIDLGLETRLERLTLSGNVFFQHFRNYISLQRTGELAFENNDDTFDIVNQADVDAAFLAGRLAAGEENEFIEVTRYRQTSARYYGAETEANLALFQDDERVLAGVFTGDWVWAEDRSTGEAIPRMPPLRLGAELRYTDRRLFLSANHRYVFRQSRTSPFEEVTNGFHWTTLQAAYSFGGTHSSSTAFVRVENLFDNEARSHTSFVKQLAPLSGRNVRVGISHRF